MIGREAGVLALVFKASLPHWGRLGRQALFDALRCLEPTCTERSACADS